MPKAAYMYLRSDSRRQLASPPSQCYGARQTVCGCRVASAGLTPTATSGKTHSVARCFTPSVVVCC